MESKTMTSVLGGIALFVGLPTALIAFVVLIAQPTQAAACDGGSTVPALGGGGGTVRPVKDIHVASPFGPRWGRHHNGVDLRGGAGAKIYAYADGTVEAAGPTDGFGQWIVIDHVLDDASGTADERKVSTVYGHMEARGVLVRKGQKVKAGQVIGRVGNNGESTGYHLHFEYWVGGRFDSGKPVDPQPYVKAARDPEQPARSSQSHEKNDNSIAGGEFPVPRPNGSGEQGGKAGAIPDSHHAAYIAAGRKYGIPWQLLAGIGWAETKHGTSTAAGVRSGQNFAGAKGPMQFLQGTWDSYGVDGNGDGRKNVYDIRDAAFGAANYLVKSGVKRGQQGVRAALWAYNQSKPYANDVLSYTWQYAKGKVTITGGGTSGQCEPGGGVLLRGGDTSPGTRGADPKSLDLTWPPERATENDPTTSGQITPRMKRLLDSLDQAPSKPASIGCFRPRDTYPDHPSGHACDLMYTPANKEKSVNAGWAMANWMVLNQKKLGVKYIIWQGKIWTAYREPERWRSYTVQGCPDPNNVTICHYDHVHVTVY